MGGEEGVYCEVGGYGEASGAMLSVRVVMDSLPVCQVFFILIFPFSNAPAGRGEKPHGMTVRCSPGAGHCTDKATSVHSLGL